MKERRLKSIPIADQEVRQLGVLNARNALRALLQEVEYEEILLRETRAFAARASPRRRYAT